MLSIPLLSTIDSHAEIRSYFAWHRQQKRALWLMFAASDGPLPALVQGFDAAQSSVEVLCTGLHALADDSNVPYAVIGSSPSGAHFLASRQITVLAGTCDSFSLSFPSWIDVSQSRDSYRCRAPSGHFLHFSATDPHLNDRVCRVHDISLGGMAVEWEQGLGLPPDQGSITETALFNAGKHRVQLGRMRVAHIRALDQGWIIGLYFEQEKPRSFDPLVLDAQRAEHLTLRDPTPT